MKKFKIILKYFLKHFIRFFGRIFFGYCFISFFSNNANIFEWGLGAKVFYLGCVFLYLMMVLDESLDKLLLA